MKKNAKNYNSFPCARVSSRVRSLSFARASICCFPRTCSTTGFSYSYHLYQIKEFVSCNQVQIQFWVLFRLCSSLFSSTGILPFCLAALGCLPEATTRSFIAVSHQPSHSRVRTFVQFHLVYSKSFEL